MAKQAYVYSGTDWVPLASEVTNLTNYYTKGEIDILDAPTGLKKIVPSSVAVGSGTGSADSLGTVTFTGVSSVSLNGVFSSTYDNYWIVWNVTNNSGTSTCTLRFRTSGTDYSTADAYGSGYGLGLGPTTITYNDSGATSLRLGSGNFQNSGGGHILVSRPTGRITYQNYVGSNATAVSYSGSCGATNFDGFSIITPGTISGTISVYGYK